jgi:hypothetical protein
MDLGLGNRTELKRFLLAASLQSGVAFDRVIESIGKGVAAQFDRFCNRRLARAVGDTFTFYADRRQVVLPRYPVESVTGIEQKDDEETGFIALDSSVMLSIGKENGLVQFGAKLGTYLSQIRITFTGGWYVVTAEESETGYAAATVVPAGATALPDDVKLAWLQQCARVWELRDKLGTGITKAGGDATFVAQTLGAIELIPMVKEVLNQHRRFN